MTWKLEDLNDDEFKATLQAVHDFDKVEAQQWEAIVKLQEEVSRLRRLLNTTIERLENDHHE